MSKSAMEQYFEGLQREKILELWKKTSEDIGCPEPEVLKMELPPAADQTDQTDQSDHSDLGPVWNKLSEQISESFLNRNC